MSAAAITETASPDRATHLQPASPVPKQELTMQFVGRQIGISSFVSLFTLILTHPLDTIRVRMQFETSKRKPSIFRIFAETYRGEGVRGFYKGLLSPVLGATPYNTTIFTVAKTIKSQLGNQFSEEVKSAISGATAGAVTLSFFCPIELLKVRAQVNRQDSIRYRQAASAIVKESGIRGLYRGFAPQFSAGVFGWGAYFFNYDFLQRMFGVSKDHADQQHQMARKMVAGGLSGCISWVVIYPLDIIKTQIQTKRERTSAITVARQVYKRAGVRGFYAGVPATVARSFTMNSIRLPLFDYMNEFFTQEDGVVALLRED